MKSIPVFFIVLFCNSRTRTSRNKKANPEQEITEMYERRDD
jgi:hypothetical protein